MRPRRPKQYCLQLDIALWRNKALLCVQIEHCTGMTVANTYGVSIENTVKFVSVGKMFVQTSIDTPYVLATVAPAT